MKTIVQKTTPGEMPFPWSEKDPYRLPVSIDRVQKLLVTLGGAAGADQGSIAAGVEEGQPGSQLQAPGNAGVHALQQGLVCAPAALAPGRARSAVLHQIHQASSSDHLPAAAASLQALTVFFVTVLRWLLSGVWCWGCCRLGEGMGGADH